MQRVVYLTPGVFDKGGISRYGRYQVRALRDLLGERAVSVISLAPPEAAGFEEPFAVDFASFGGTRAGKAFFVAAATHTVGAGIGARPRVIWSAHLHFAPVALALARATSATLALDVYGSEVWTNVGRLRAAALRRADWVVSDCHNTRAYLIDHGLRAPSRTVVHWDCVDTDRFSPGDPGDVLARYGVPAAAGAVTVLTLGRMAPGTEYKGYDRLIEVFARLPAAAPLRLVLAGDGARRGELLERAVGLGLGGRVYFTGSVREQDLPALYRACDVFSLVTTAGPGMGEGIPLTPLEAAACGKPILVGDQDGSREAAADGETGFVLDSRDASALYARLLTLAGDAALRARMGEAARARIVREHAYPRFRARVAELLAAMGLSC
jgi:phosphatidylinositol alpha-1,6-mannosyltransferase